MIPLAASSRVLTRRRAAGRFDAGLVESLVDARGPVRVRFAVRYDGFLSAAVPRGVYRTDKEQSTNNKQQAANKTSRSSSSSSSSMGVSVLERFSRASTEAVTVQDRDRRPDGEGVRARAASDSFTDITHMHTKEHSRHEPQRLQS